MRLAQRESKQIVQHEFTVIMNSKFYITIGKTRAVD